MGWDNVDLLLSEDIACVENDNDSLIFLIRDQLIAIMDLKWIKVSLYLHLLNFQDKTYKENKADQKDNDLGRKDMPSLVL